MTKYRVLRGKHVEGRKVYGKNEPAGDVVDSKSDLLKMNAPNSIKFEKLDDPEGTLENAVRRGRSVAPSDKDVPVTMAPGGQVSSGVQGGSPFVPEETKEESAAKAANASSAKPIPKDIKEYHAAVERMNINELKKHADEEEIDLKGATKREDMIRTIKAG